MKNQVRIGNAFNVLSVGQLIAAITEQVSIAQTLAENTGKYFAHTIAINVNSVELFEETLSDGSKVYNLEIK